MIKSAKQIQPPELSVPGIRKDADSFIVSIILCSFSIALFVILSPNQFLHWFTIPVTLCGVIIGIDAIDWLRGRMDQMDPVGWVGLFGLHFFFLAPLLIVLWDYKMVFLTPLPDWRPWIGGMAILNAFGLVIYRITRGWIKLQPARTRQKMRVINPQMLVIVLYLGLIITAALQIYVYIQSGGIEGYISQYEQRYSEGNFQGSGVLFTISESFPFLLMIAIVTIARSHGVKSWPLILGILLLFFVTRIFFGGLRGSRGNTVYAMIWAVGIIHLWLRPLSRQFLLIGAIVAVIFMYIMGFYKGLGSDFTRVLENPTELSTFEEETNRTFVAAIVSDLSRADVQAYILHNLSRWDSFPYGRGRTYLAGYTVIVPRALWPDKPPHKVMEGTQALYGPGTYIPGVRQASRVYGLMGEAMLNFGVFIAPLLFVTLGLLVGLVRRWYYNLHQDDIFRLWIPFLILFCVTYIVSDSDNNSVTMVIRPLVPAIVLWFGSKSVSIEQHSIDQ